MYLEMYNKSYKLFCFLLSMNIKLHLSKFIPSLTYFKSYNLFCFLLWMNIKLHLSPKIHTIFTYFKIVISCVFFI